MFQTRTPGKIGCMPNWASSLNKVFINFIIITQAECPHYYRAKGDTLTQTTLSHQTKVYTLTHAAAVQLTGTLLPRLQCPTQHTRQGRHSVPGYSMPPYNRAKGEALTQATLSHQAKVYTLTQAAAVQLKGTL